MLKNDPKLKEKLSTAEQIIRDDVLMLLTSADMKRKIKSKGPEHLESYLKYEVTALLKTHYHDKIILKELKVF